MQELFNEPMVINAVVAVIFISAACVGLTKGFYKQIMPFAVIVLAGLGAIVLSVTLTTPVTEKIYPLFVEMYVKDDGRGLNLAELSQDARERLSPLVPRGFLRRLDEAERSGALGETVTEIFRDASDNGLGAAVNEGIGAVAEGEIGEKLHEVGEAIGKVDEDVGNAITGAIDAAQEGAVGSAIDSALDTASSGVVGDAVNDAVHTARVEVTKAIAQQTAAYVHLILFCIVWVGLMVALTIIKNTFGLAARLPVVKQVDKAGGAVLGLIECAVVFWCLAWVDKITGFGWLAQQAEKSWLLALFV